MLTSIILNTLRWCVAFGPAALPGAQCAASIPSAAPEGTTVGFCVCSPGPVSDKCAVELRLAIRNTSAAGRVYSVRFFLDRAVPDQAIQAESVDVAPAASRLVSYWWETAGHVGNRKLLYRVESNGDLVAQGDWSLEVFPSNTRSLPWAQGVWLDPGNMSQTGDTARRATPAKVRRMVDSMRDIGATMIVISYVEGVAFRLGPFYPSKVPELGKSPLSFDAIGVVMDEAARNGQHVILGLGRGPDLTLVYGGVRDPSRVRKALDLGKRVAQELWDRYSHYSSFYGWYLSHEPTDLAAAAVFLNPITDFMHSLAPEKPVVVAPSGTPILSSQVLAAAHYDVLVYQDAVGAGYVPYKYTWNPENRLEQLDAVCRSYRDAHRGSGKHLWSDTETWQMAGPSYGHPFPAAFSRVLRQMRIERKYFDTLTLYEFMATMMPPGVGMGPKDPRSADLYRKYKEYYMKKLTEAQRQESMARNYIGTEGKG